LEDEVDEASDIRVEPLLQGLEGETALQEGVLDLLQMKLRAQVDQATSLSEAGSRAVEIDECGGGEPDHASTRQRFDGVSGERLHALAA
jgi:hypothetical protein